MGMASERATDRELQLSGQMIAQTFVSMRDMQVAWKIPGTICNCLKIKPETVMVEKWPLGIQVVMKSSKPNNTSREETAMATRFREPIDKACEYEFRMMEVSLLKRSGVREVTTSQVVAVDNHWETLSFVRENMDDVIDIVIKMKKLEEAERKRMDESARIFRENLEPLFASITKNSHRNVLGRLSMSLRKALIQMAMERYHADRDSVCRALGITPDILDQEMTACGICKPKAA